MPAQGTTKLIFWATSINSQLPLLGFRQTVLNALRTNDLARVESLFRDPLEDATSLARLAQTTPVRRLGVCILPTPPGWKGYGQYWLEFHTVEGIEQDHDPVYKLSDGPQGWRIGKEVAEDDLGGVRVSKLSYQASIWPEKVTVHAKLDVYLESKSLSRAPVFRLNENYGFAANSALTVGDDKIASPSPGQLLRVGSLLIPWEKRARSSYAFSYEGSIPTDVEDEIHADVAAITAWWIPSLGRLPCPVSSQIDAPANWVVRAEGNLTHVERHGERTTSNYSCPLPISYPKIIGGRYALMAEADLHGQRFRVYQLKPHDVKQAQLDLKNEVDSAAFYESKLGPLPFKGYDAFDSNDYYGIESYSHTLLKKGIGHFISHEMGHTYFGGMAPCAYIHDSWNEGVTQYIDSVVRFGDADKSVEGALRGLNIHVPLTQMGPAYSCSEQSYWRGCCVMKMLENEIGLHSVLEGLKHIAHDRIGRDTRWDDLRAYFERASGRDLSWFWSQWIDNATFPTLEIEKVAQTGKHGLLIRIKQSGVKSPYRLRFAIVAGKTRTQVVLTKQADDFRMRCESTTEKIRLDVLGLCLANLRSSR